jgi:hypothetical protein
MTVGLIMPRSPFEAILAGARQLRPPLVSGRGCRATEYVQGVESGEGELPPPLPLIHPPPHHHRRKI